MPRNLIHLTDLHVGDNADGDHRFDKLIDRLVLGNSLCSPDQAVIVITGDFLERVQHEEPVDESPYTRVIRGLQRLKDKGYCLSGCPGNHDLFDEQSDLRQALMAKFNARLLPLFEGGPGFRRLGNLGYPLCHVVDDAWTLIVLNSEAEATDGGPFVKGEGRLGQAQLTRLGALLQDPAVKGPIVIALHHDPFRGGIANQIRLVDDEAFFTTLRPHIARIRGILFGHLHNRKNYRETRRSEVAEWITTPLILDGGVSCNFDGRSKDESYVRLLDIASGTIKHENLLGSL